MIPLRKHLCYSIVSCTYLCYNFVLTFILPFGIGYWQVKPQQHYNQREQWYMEMKVSLFLFLFHTRYYCLGLDLWLRQRLEGYTDEKQYSGIKISSHTYNYARLSNTYLCRRFKIKQLLDGDLLLLNPIFTWTLKKKCPSLAPPRGNFYKT